MNDLKIDPEFRDLIPPLSDEERKQLEENILHDGIIQDPLKIWQGTLVDGHNRYEIAQAHNLEFKTFEMQFDSRDDVKIWIIKNQFGRRNLSAYDRSLLALKLKPVIATEAKKRMLANQNNDTAKSLQKSIKPAPKISWELRNTVQDDNEAAVKKSCQQVTTPPIKQRDKNRTNKTNYQIAKMAGVSEDTIRKVEKIEEKATPEIKAALKAGELSVNTAYKEVRKAERKEEIQKQVDQIEQKALEEFDGLFDVIVIDPPWNYGDGHLYHVDGWRVSAPYPEMTQDALKDIKLPAADNCVLCVWTTNQFIWDAKELIDTWGFNYRFMFVWNKQKMGVGRRIRMQCEFCLVALKGNPVFKDVHDVRDIIEEPRREHSRKPERFYRIIDSMFAGRKLDYFSRTQREGWTTYGNDTNKFTLA